MIKEKPRLLGRQVWCQSCINERPPRIKSADFLIPVRQNPYDLCRDGLDIDPRVNGICQECLSEKGRFQQMSAEPVDINHRHLVYKSG
jgi:hypothetical protein